MKIIASNNIGINIMTWWWFMLLAALFLISWLKKRNHFQAGGAISNTSAWDQPIERSLTPDDRLPMQGDGFFTTPLNVLWSYYWPVGLIDGLPYRYGGMTRYSTYPYRSARYYPGWYYRQVGWLGGAMGN